MGRRTLRERLFYFLLVPSIVIAVLILGVVAFRTTFQIERLRRQTLVDATFSLADDRVDRLEKLIVAEDNVILAHADPASVSAIAPRWLPTAARETRTVRAILVLAADAPDRPVIAFASRAPGPEDEAFRRVLVHRLLPRMDLDRPPLEELRHLHQNDGDQDYLLSYWSRFHQGHRYLVVAWHDVGTLVHEILPSLYRDDRTSRMNIVDEQGRIVFGKPIHVGELTVGRPFPTTLYKWRLQVALTEHAQLEEKIERNRILQMLMVGLAGVVALAGLAIVVIASVKERRLAALKSDFVANVSHELKTPLSLVRMFGELLLSGRAPTEERRRRYLSIIVSESERLTALIENVLDFAKVERGKAAYEFAEGDVGEVVARAVEIYRYRADREGVELAFSQPAALPPARLDGRALELAVINLLDNALKYAREGGRIDASVALEGGGIAVRITDRGPGIEADEQARIFERFMRGRAARGSQVRGSGIGLALVKHIAESHGGSARVESPTDGAGRGASFVIVIPALVVEPAPSPAPAPVV